MRAGWLVSGMEWYRTQRWRSRLLRPSICWAPKLYLSNPFRKVGASDWATGGLIYQRSYLRAFARRSHHLSLRSYQVQIPLQLRTGQPNQEYIDNPTNNEEKRTTLAHQPLLDRALYPPNQARRFAAGSRSKSLADVASGSESESTIRHARFSKIASGEGPLEESLGRERLERSDSNRGTRRRLCLEGPG